jgi:hypothetical protein
VLHSTGALVEETRPPCRINNAPISYPAWQRHAKQAKARVSKYELRLLGTSPRFCPEFTLPSLLPLPLNSPVLKFRVPPQQRTWRLCGSPGPPWPRADLPENPRTGTCLYLKLKLGSPASAAPASHGTCVALDTCVPRLPMARV